MSVHTSIDQCIYMMNVHQTYVCKSVRASIDQYIFMMTMHIRITPICVLDNILSRSQPLIRKRESPRALSLSLSPCLFLPLRLAISLSLLPSLSLSHALSPSHPLPSPPLSLAQLNCKTLCGPGGLIDVCQATVYVCLQSERERERERKKAREREREKRNTHTHSLSHSSSLSLLFSLCLSSSLSPLLCLTHYMQMSRSGRGD